MNNVLFLEIKNEYTIYLVDMLTPYIYEGLTHIYKEAVDLSVKECKSKNILLIFQKMLHFIDQWTETRIIAETNRIKNASNSNEYFDDLVKTVIKSYIILLTHSNTMSNVIGQSFYNQLSVYQFIHHCYIECGKDAYNNPYLFFHNIDTLDYKRNQIIIHKQIGKGIVRAIRKILPISIILKEYLVNSMPLIEEPKIELITKSVKPNASPKNDVVVNQKVAQLVKEESSKSDKEKIQAIINLDKLLKSVKLSTEHHKPKTITQALLETKAVTQQAADQSEKIDYANLDLIEAYGV